MLTGSLVAVATPMLPGGALDLASYRRLIDFHVANGTTAIIAVGTTGESPTVDFDEHKELIRVAVAHAHGRIPIVAGTGGNSTAEGIELAASCCRARQARRYSCCVAISSGRRGAGREVSTWASAPVTATRTCPSACSA